MTAFFATEYTIHFDDTMAYGSHHFLTGFKFQCAARETFMFGEFLFDTPGVPEEYDQVLFFTSDAYSRNLKSKRLGDRVAILLSIEEWGLASARFCYRVIDADGDAVCAGFQTLVCADVKSGNPVPLPPKVRDSMDQVRQIEEPIQEKSFRDRALAGGSLLEPLFTDEICNTAVEFLKTRYPEPQVVYSSGDLVSNSQSPTSASLAAMASNTKTTTGVANEQTNDHANEAWVFAGQGAFDEDLLVARVNEYFGGLGNDAERQQCESVIANVIGGDAGAIFSGSTERITAAIATTPELLQPAIHLQNMLGGLSRQRSGNKPSVLTGHSFGEIAAFGLAGCFDLVTGVHIVCLRATSISQYGPDGGGLMVAASTRPPVATEIAIQGLNQVVIAGRNHDQQTLLSGPKSQLTALHDALSNTGIKSTPIPSPTCFHHPQLAYASNQWLAEIRKLPITSPEQPVFTCLGRRLIQPNEDVAETLADQLLQPFDLQGSIADIAASGTTTFVDCGSTGSLARLIEKSAACGISVIQQNNHSNATNNAASFNGQPASPQAPVNSLATATMANAASATTLPSIAIVGSGCILPGGATSPAQLFESITQQRMGIVDVRNLDAMWSQDFYSETLVPDKSTSHLSGRVNNDDIRCPTGIDANVFESFTRLQKLLCISIAPLVGTLEGAEKVTCLVGATADGFEDQDEATSLEYLGIDPTNEQVNARLDTAKSFGRMPHDAVQEVFDVVIRPGLSVTLVDAACASSLYTVALGMNALENGKADAVIAGGCFCPGPGNSCLFSQFNGTTATGCRPFDANADGVVFSEAAAFVTLRRLGDANRLGMPVTAAVRAAGLSSDGRSPSANVPQTKGQIKSLQRCYTNYDVAPKTIQAIEGHGTSTIVGDSTELETLRQFYSDYVSKSIPVHSLKGTLGHAGWAAGTASLIAACEYLQRRTFPGQAFHRTASEKLSESAGTLSVIDKSLPLPSGPLRVAVDGFGFGGANAHMVLENIEATQIFGPAKRKPQAEDELVFVALHQLQPELEVSGGRRFDRAKAELPETCIVLPELCDDMDISQTLTVNLTNAIISKLPNFNDDIRRNTSLVLALQGKTERGVEATARVLTTRFLRQLGDLPAFKTSITEAFDRARPSRAYTLQCMMPNVATGRAALLLDLNGPNFVVDGGADSLASAIEAASLLLHSGDESGTKLAIVAAIDAAAKSLPDNQANQIVSDEFAMALGMATKSTAIAQGWNILGSVSNAGAILSPTETHEKPQVVMHRQADQLLRQLDPTFPATVKTNAVASSNGLANGLTQNARAATSGPELESATDYCPIYTPTWIRRDLQDQVTARRDGAFVVITKSNESFIQELLTTLPRFCSRHMIVVAGKRATETAQAFNNPNVISVNLDDDQSLNTTLRQTKDFAPDALLATERIESWELVDSLSNVALGNDICEALFLLAKDNLQRLNDGKLELLGLFPGSFDRAIHTQTGATAGLVKSILREIPQAKCKLVCTDNHDLASALEKLAFERAVSDADPEVSWASGQRLVRRLRLASTKSPRPQVALSQDSVIVASGGARGVTAVMLESLALQYGCRIFALGRSPLEQGPAELSLEEQESWFYEKFIEEHPDKKPTEMKWAFEKAQARWEAAATIDHLNRVGGTVEYLQVDVTDEAQVQQAIHQIHSRYHRIDMLLHGAGVQKSMLLQDRTLADFRRTYSVKVTGLKNLVSAAQQQIGFLPAVHALTSAYSIFGNDGQHDYCAANETMDRLCDMTNRDPNTNWSTIAWLAWDGIGMTRGSEYRILAEQRKLSGVDAATGQRIFRDVISGKTGAAINVPLSEAEQVQYQLLTAPPVDMSSNPAAIEIPIDLAQVGCLPHHVVHGTPTLPGAWIVDYFVQAALKLRPDAASITEVVVEDLAFRQFVRFAHQTSPNVRVFAEDNGNTIRTWLVQDVLHPSGEILKKDVVRTLATLSFAQNDSNLVSKLADYCNGQMQSLRDPYCLGNGQAVDLSGPFDCMGTIEIGECGRIATVDVSASRLWPTTAPALILDAAWRAAVAGVSGDKDLFVPTQTGRLILSVGQTKQPTNEASLQWTIRSSKPTITGDDASWERTEVIDGHGNVKLVVENGGAKKME